MNQGWSSYSTISGSTPSGERPEKFQAVLLQPVLVGGVDLVAVAVAFGNLGGAAIDSDTRLPRVSAAG